MEDKRRSLLAGEVAEERGEMMKRRRSREDREVEDDDAIVCGLREKGWNSCEFIVLAWLQKAKAKAKGKVGVSEG